ncbi:MAG: 6-bladed beta-propeller [Tannerella sp.]|nr:6-bladed beta-propeller [Tannerella sp.]
MMYRHLLKILFVLFFFSCRQDASVDVKNIYISIDPDHVNYQPAYTDEMFVSMEYVCLETSPECLLIAEMSSYYVTDKYIVAYNKMFGGTGAYLFERKSGKFLYEIGKRGQGPDEYFTIYSEPFNERDDIFYVYRSLQRLGIDIHTNKVVEKVIKPAEQIADITDDNIIFTKIDNIYKMDSVYYIGYVNNDTGDLPYLLVIFNKDGKIVKTFPNHRKYKDYQTDRSTFNPGQFYEYDGSLYFKEPNYNDTVFRVSPDTIVPHIVFELGNMKPDYAERENKEKNLNRYWIKYVQETERYIFFDYNDMGYDSGSDDNVKYYDGYYDKRTKKTVVTVSESKSKRGFIHKNRLFPPFHIARINKYEDAVCIIPASDMMSYMEENKDVTFPAEFYDLTFDDNPVLIIAKVK